MLWAWELYKSTSLNLKISRHELLFKSAIVSKLDPVIITGFFKLSLSSCHDNELVTNVNDYYLTLQHNKSTALELS